MGGLGTALAGSSFKMQILNSLASLAASSQLF
jgi:hypothetical protein